MFAYLHLLVLFKGGLCILSTESVRCVFIISFCLNGRGRASSYLLVDSWDACSIQGWPPGWSQWPRTHSWCPQDSREPGCTLARSCIVGSEVELDSGPVKCGLLDCFTKQFPSASSSTMSARAPGWCWTQESGAQFSSPTWVPGAQQCMMLEPRAGT